MPSKWPWKVIGLIVGAVLLLIIAVAGLSKLGFHFDPFNLQGRKLENAQTQAETATSDADARGLESQGEIASATRVDAYTHQIIEVRTVGAEASAEARTAPDATEPLAPERASRLHRFDQQLCASAPRVCDPAAIAAASGGDAAVQAGDSPGEPDAG